MLAPDALPVVMRVAEVAAFMRMNPKTILNKLAAGTFLPLPFASHPYRWRGGDIEAWYRGEFREATDKLRFRVRHARRSA